MASLLNLTQAAKQAGVSRGTIYRAIRAGQLPAASGGRPGRLTLIDPEALRHWCAREGLHIPDLPAPQDASPPPEPPDVAMLMEAVREEFTSALRYFTEWLESSFEHANERLLERLSARFQEQSSERLERLERLVERLERSMTRPERAAERSTTTPAIPTVTKAEVAIRLRALRAQGLSLQAIAAQLNREGVPTLSGTGRWQKGTVAKLLAGK